MKQTADVVSSRRRFLRFLAGSPVIATFGLHASWFDPLWARENFEGEVTGKVAGGSRGLSLDDLISSAKEAVNVFDFQPVAKNRLPPAHYGYLATSVDDDSMLQVNRRGFTKFQLRMRRLVDVRQVDMSTEILGTKMETPIILDPVSSQRAFHPEGELAVARATKKQKHLQILSTLATTSIEDVAEARGAPVWHQLFPTSDWEITKAFLERAEGAGCPVVCLTVTNQGGGNTETRKRSRKRDNRDCTGCHEEGFQGYVKRRPLFDGLDISNLTSPIARGMNWDLVKRLKAQTRMKLVIKGIVTREDAALCVEHGADGIVVSNHGGRAESSGRSTIECLPEVIDAVAGRIPVLIDSGFRRGTDIFKALALGAQGICIGRPYIWGLAAFGQEGVEVVLGLLRAELELVMKQAGTTSIDKIGRSSVMMKSR